MMCVERLLSESRSKIVKMIALEYGLSEKEMCEFVDRELKIKYKERRVSSNIILPWCGSVIESKCQGIRLNYGLYTQCSKEIEIGDEDRKSVV